MRKLSYFVASSLDGYIAGPQGQIDWLFTDGDYGYQDFYAQVDELLMGRATFEQMLAFDPYPNPGKKAHVFSRSHRVWPVEEAVAVQEAPADYVRRLKRQPGQTLWLVGGGLLAGALLEAGLLDEMVLSLHPVVLGGGRPLFEGVASPKHGQLIHSERFPSGLVQLSFQFKP